MAGNTNKAGVRHVLSERGFKLQDIAGGFSATRQSLMDAVQSLTNQTAVERAKKWAFTGYVSASSAIRFHFIERFTATINQLIRIGDGNRLTAESAALPAPILIPKALRLLPVQ